MSSKSSQAKGNSSSSSAAAAASSADTFSDVAASAGKQPLGLAPGGGHDAPWALVDPSDPQAVLTHSSHGGGISAAAQATGDSSATRRIPLKSFSAGLLRVNVAVAAPAGGPSHGPTSSSSGSSGMASGAGAGSAASSQAGGPGSSTYPAPIQSKTRSSGDVLPRDALDMDPLAFPAEDGGFGIPDVHQTMQRAKEAGSAVALHAMQDAGAEPPTEGVDGAMHMQSLIEAAEEAEDSQAKGMGKRGASSGTRSSSSSSSSAAAGGS